MWLFIFRKLGLGEVKPMAILLQIVDKFITYLWGVMEDILVKVDKFFFSVDFVVLDIEKYRKNPHYSWSTIPSYRDMQCDEMTLRVNEEKVKFNIYHGNKSSNIINTCCRVDVINSCMVDTYRNEKKDES